MRTNALVGWVGVAVTVCLVNLACAQEEFQLFPLQEIASTGELHTLSDLETGEMLAAADCPCDDDCYSGRCPHWFAGVEASFLNIIATTGGRITLSFNDNTTVGTEIAFDDGNGVNGLLGYAPRLWVGRQFGEKWSVAGRFWSLNQSLNQRPDLVDGTTPLPTFGTYTGLDTVDMHNVAIEVARSIERGPWKVDAIGGVCQASMENYSQIHAFGVITTGNFANLFLSNGSKFDGAGLVGGLAARRQIGDGPLSFFASARGSHLWGHSDSFGRSAGSIASSPSAPLVGAATVTRNNAEATLDIFELQLGGQWDFELRRLPVNAFFRAAFEYQYWHIDGPPTGGAGFGGTIGDLTTNSFSRAGLGETSLAGATIGAGFTW
jgi:hypothetical protein